MRVLGGVQQDMIKICAFVFCQSSSNMLVIGGCVSYFVHILPALTGGFQEVKGTCSVGNESIIYDTRESFQGFFRNCQELQGVWSCAELQGIFCRGIVAETR